MSGTRGAVAGSSVEIQKGCRAVELPKETLKHLGKLLREKTSAVIKKPLPSSFLFLLSELDTRRVKEREALHRFWKRSTGQANDGDKSGTE
jgi:hypothetical protein